MRLVKEPSLFPIHPGFYRLPIHPAISQFALYYILMTDTITLDHVLKPAEQLSPLDKVRLIERVAPQLERDLQAIDGPRRSLRGLWKGVDISAEDISEVRRDMWANFPRTDV